MPHYSKWATINRFESSEIERAVAAFDAVSQTGLKQFRLMYGKRVVKERL